jgi:methionine-rich copper-binding protein CopC
MTGRPAGRRLRPLAGIGLLTAASLVYAASPASAHSVLLGTTPAASGRVASPPSSCVLTFNEMPRGEFSVVHVIGPDGLRRDSGHVQVINDTVTEELGGSRPAGEYTVDWRVISADGHPVSGQFSYTATRQAAALAAPAPDVTGAAAAKRSGGSNTGAIAGGSIAVLVVVLGGVTLVLRRRGRRQAGAQGLPDEDDS